MKKSLLLFLTIECFALFCFAQNPLWVCPPNFIDVPFGSLNSLPTGHGQSNFLDDPFDYYDGKPAQFASNGIADIDGNLRFFVIDGLIYDETGAYVSYAWDIYPPNVETLSNNPTDYIVEGNGGSEIIIVPHPTDCNKYYFFGSIVQSTNQNNFQSISSYPCYAIYDALNKVVIKRGKWYSNPIDQNNPGSEIFSFFSSGINGDLPMIGGVWGEQIDKNGILSMAATDKQPDGSRYVAAHLESMIIIIKIHPDGTLGYWKNYSTGIGSNSKRRPEMEIEYRSSDNSFLLATAGFYNGQITNDYVVQIFNFSSDFLTYLGNYNFTFPSSDNNPNVAAIHGLEFSPNLSKLYITNSSSDLVQNNLHYVDLTITPPSLLAINNPVTNNFKNGFIERNNSALYFGSNEGLYRLTNPDATSNFNISSTPIIPFFYEENYGSTILQTEEQKAFSLPDQIDGMDYNAHLIENTSCCISSANFDKNTFSATTNATWLPGFGSNPLDAVNDGNNVITIRDELRIPKGKVVTIRNMTIQFAPGAKLIIEEGDGVLNGGRLNLDNTRLTVDTRCTNDELWEGVEVWGNAMLVQGTPTGNSQQGRLFITGNSVIEHAKKGVVLSAFNNSTGTYITSKGGGVLRATGTTFRNNQRDIVFWNYQSPNGTVNFSYVTNCRFILDDVLKSGVVPINHVELRGVRGVTLRGNDFKHINAEYHRVGNGVFATNSTFTVAAGCTSGTIPCTSFDPNTFENLNMGIQATNSSSILSFNVDRNVFINNNVGIRANATSLASITRNTFKVFETPRYKTGGVYLFKSTKYVVEENNFGIANTTALSGAKAYGLVINNSGPESNLVYRNTFEDLYIGGQSEDTNANTQIGNATGLVWKCNTFRDISQHDLTVIKGNIAYNQGYMDPSNAITANQKAANNQFSLQFEDPTIAHDFLLAGAEAINYVYTQGAMTVPDSYTTSLMTVQQSNANGNPVNFDYVTGCPSRIGKTKIQLNADLVVFQNKVNQNTSILNTGTLATLQSTLNLTNAGNKKNQLLAKSPYLSDEVLIAYMLQSPPNGHLQQVLNANSPLSQAVLDVLMTRNLPNGVLNNILSNQTSAPSVRAVLQQDTWYNEANLYRTIDDLLREVILDTDTTRTLDDAVTILAPRQEKVYQEMLVNLKITRNELLDATNLLTTISGYGRTQELNEVQINMKASSDPTCYLMNSLTDQQLLQDIAADTLFCVCSERAKALLCDIIPMDDSYDFLEDENSLAKSSMFTAVTSESPSIDDWQVVLYPNTTNANITIMNNELSDLNIAVYDVLGSLQATFRSIENASTIDLSSFKNGVYLFVIEELSTGKTTTVRVMKK